MNWIAMFTPEAVPMPPPLPSPSLQAWALDVSWAVILAATAIWVLSCLPIRRTHQWMAASMLSVACLLPSTWSPSYWLGLAFQFPSVSSCLLAAWYVYFRLSRSKTDGFKRTEKSLALWLVLVGVGLGWLLMLDTFALLPGSLYALGFHPIAPVAVLLVALLPWIFSGRSGFDSLLHGGLILVLLTHVVWRLPNGNAWSALMDPWLWLGLHFLLIRLARKK